jgi:hypothetical protein
MQQGQEQEPNNQMAGGYVVHNSPFGGLNRVLQSYLGAKMMMRGNDGYKAMGEKYTADQNAAIDKVKNALAPAPAIPIPLANANGVEGQMVERSMPEKRAAIQEAMLSQFPNVRSAATAMNSNLQADQSREDTQKHQELQAQLTREQNASNLLLQLQDRQLGREQQAELMKELAKIKQVGGGANPYFQPVQTAQGVYRFNARTGALELATDASGKPVVGAVADPKLQGDIAKEKAGGKEMGESEAKAEIGLPQTIDNANKTIQNIDDIISHPGFSSYVGATLKPFASKIDGTPEADVAKRIDEVKGGAFLQAFETLKGGGQITEAEGKKATDAITRMDKAQSESEFKTAAREFQQIIRNGVTRAQKKAGQTPTAPAQPKGPSIDDLLNKYK